MRSKRSAAQKHTVLLVLFFLSGFTALVYQVLWVRELGMLFGSTARAAAISIAIFFAGLAAGARFWGARARRFQSALRWFGLLEIGVAATALGYFLLLDAYYLVYPLIYAQVGHSAVLDGVTKAAIAATLLFPTAFLIGGTLPLMSEHLIRGRGRLARTGTLLYAVNTAGAACGALTAGFVLPPVIGIQAAYASAIVLDLGVGLVAALKGRPRLASADTGGATGAVTSQPLRTAAGHGSGSPQRLQRIIRTVAFCSGFATLAIEVIWTRLFAQVLQNSAYTYALVLTVFLVSLATGAVAAHLLARLTRVREETTLVALLMGAAAAAAASPWLFYCATDGLAYLSPERGFAAYLLSVAGVAIAVMLLPGVLLGSVLPYLMRFLERGYTTAGAAVGGLISADTLGAIAGSLAGGFVLLPTLGVWRSLLVLAAMYPALLLLFAATVPLKRNKALLLAAAAAVALLLWFEPPGLRNIAFGVRPGEVLVEGIEGSHATVAAVDTRDGSRVLRVNNYYTLGSSGSLEPERNQTAVALLQHPAPRRVFYLGMGTGITAGAALFFPVEEVVVCEILPEVVTLAERQFSRWNNHLFGDERVTVHAEDGRNCLMRSRATYDVIVSDLFTPWKQGTGNLYTLEHYRLGHRRLREGGIYVQWIPLYQVSERELGFIARTMNEVFPRVTIWRGDHYASASIVALVGHRDADHPFDPSVVAGAARDAFSGPEESSEYYEAMLLRHYVGNLSASGVFAAAPLNTDDMPRVEYVAPRTDRAHAAGEPRFLTGDRRERLYRTVREALPPEDDPFLAELTATQLKYVHAGHYYSRYAYAQEHRAEQAAARYRDEFRGLSPVSGDHVRSPARHLE